MFNFFSSAAAKINKNDWSSRIAIQKDQPNLKSGPFNLIIICEFQTQQTVEKDFSFVFNQIQQPTEFKYK